MSKVTGEVRRGGRGIEIVDGCGNVGAAQNMHWLLNIGDVGVNVAVLP